MLNYDSALSSAFIHPHFQMRAFQAVRLERWRVDAIQCRSISVIFLAKS